MECAKYDAIFTVSIKSQPQDYNRAKNNMITLKNPSVVKETEKAYLISFTGVSKPETSILTAWDQDFETIEMWFPKTFIKQDGEKFLVKENKNFGIRFEVELASKIVDLKFKKEKTEGIMLAGMNFKINRNGKIWFAGETVTFSVGISDKQPSGYYERHRYCKGENNFGKVFFIDGIDKDNEELLKAVRFWLMDNYNDHGYGHKFMLKSEELNEDGKSKWINLGTWS